MKASKRGFQFAAQNLQESLIEGLLQNGINLNVLSIPSLSSYPKGCSILRVKDDTFKYGDLQCGITVGYTNLPFIKSWNKGKVTSEIEKWYLKSQEEKIIFIYALLKEPMQIAVNFKKTHPDVKLCVIVPDLPRFMGYNRILKVLGFQKRDIEKIYSLVDKFDAYVVLAEKMIEDLHVGNKKYRVVEGIFSDNSETTNVEKNKKKVILYTGNIGNRYGINLLMDAFELIKDPNYRLWIRGNGDNTHVLEKAKRDSRIKYIEPLSKKDLILLQKRATLLVNPVSPEMEFTRYFFPSKTMDYMASGTPTVMFKLECLPADYYSHLFFFEKPTPESMANTLMELCNKEENELKSFGLKASQFIKEEKNAFNQVQKIINLFESLF